MPDEFPLRRAGDADWGFASELERPPAQAHERFQRTRVAPPRRRRAHRPRAEPRRRRPSCFSQSTSSRSCALQQQARQSRSGLLFGARIRGTSISTPTCPRALPMPASPTSTIMPVSARLIPRAREAIFSDPLPASRTENGHQRQRASRSPAPCRQQYPCSGQIESDPSHAAGNITRLHGRVGAKSRPAQTRLPVPGWGVRSTPSCFGRMSTSTGPRQDSLDHFVSKLGDPRPVQRRLRCLGPRNITLGTQVSSRRVTLRRNPSGADASMCA